MTPEARLLKPAGAVMAKSQFNSDGASAPSSAVNSCLTVTAMLMLRGTRLGKRPIGCCGSGFQPRSSACRNSQTQMSRLQAAPTTARPDRGTRPRTDHLPQWEWLSRRNPNMTFLVTLWQSASTAALFGHWQTPSISEWQPQNRRLSARQPRHSV